MLTNSKTIAEVLGAPGVGVAALAATVAVAWVALIVWAVRQERALRRAEAAVDQPTAVPA